MNKSGRKRKSEAQAQNIRRVSISKSGAIEEHDVPLSTLKREAIDLSPGSFGMTFLLTSEAAVRVTEKAILKTLDNAWQQMVAEKKASGQIKSGDHETQSAPETDVKLVEPKETETIDGEPESRSKFA